MSAEQSATTPFGFPGGRVAKTLREILNRDLKDHDVEVISVVLFGHLLIEHRINQVLYSLIAHDLPRGGGAADLDGKEMEDANQEMEDGVWRKLTRMQLARKLDLLEPPLKFWYPEILQMIREIIEVRNAIAHGKDPEKVLFKGLSIWTEEGIEKFFIAVQSVSWELPRFAEQIDAPRAAAERWAKRLRELGEPLY
jgi:hypothetical protein